MSETLVFHPLTSDRWGDFEDLFGPDRGGNSGCWCLWPRLPRADYILMPKAERKAMFHKIVDRGPAPGVLAYRGAQAVGWCAVGQRGSFARFQASKVSKPVEDTSDPGSTFAITCFFVRKGHQRRGLMRELSLAAIAMARAAGGRAVEVCPIEADRPLVWGDGFVGIVSVFQRLGFREIARRSPRRPLMRLDLAD
jgi:GNAT superfamily N-acetyltransferase